MDDPIQMPIVISDDPFTDVCKDGIFFWMWQDIFRSLFKRWSAYDQDGDQTEMFWLLEDTVAFGGRAALLPLLFILAEQFLEKSPLQNMEASW